MTVLRLLASDGPRELALGLEAREVARGLGILLGDDAEHVAAEARDRGEMPRKARKSDEIAAKGYEGFVLG